MSALAGPASDRDRLIERHLPLVRALAHRYARAGEPVEDLVQVGAIGLIKAVDRYDPARCPALEPYAATVIAGEIRHHLRDSCAPVRLPRRLREDGVYVRFEPLAGPDDGAPAPDPPAPAQDLAATIDDRVVLANALRSLHPRTRRLLALCYFADLSQAQAAAVLGISPVQASRLLRDALTTLRAALSDTTPPSVRKQAVASPRTRG